MPDKTLHCPDCNTDFTFTDGEQRFYASKGLAEPRRCKPCRDRRKQQAGGPAKPPDPSPVEFIGGVQPREQGRRRDNRRRRDRDDDNNY